MLAKNPKCQILIIAIFFISNLFAARKVLIIGIDGVQADALRHSNVPTLRWLKKMGLVLFQHGIRTLPYQGHHGVVYCVEYITRNME